MANQAHNTLTIGAFAESAGVNVETIRFYQRKGLLPQPDRPYGSIRRYGETDVARGSCSAEINGHDTVP